MATNSVSSNILDVLSKPKDKMRFDWGDGLDLRIYNEKGNVIYEKTQTDALEDFMSVLGVKKKEK
jgi:hypothetical protein